MNKEKEAFESHLHLCKPQYKSTGVHELLTMPVILAFDTDSY